MNSVSLVFKMAFRMFVHEGNWKIYNIFTLPVLSITFASFLAIASLSIINGFDNSLKEGLLESLPHVRITSLESDIADEVINLVEQEAQILGSASFTTSGSYVIANNNYAFVNIIATSSVNNLPSIFSGQQVPLENLFDVDNQIFISSALSESLSLKDNDSVILYFPMSSDSVFGRLPRLKSFNVQLIPLDSLMSMDEFLVIMSLDTFSQFIPSGLTVNIVDLTLEQPMNVNDWNHNIPMQFNGRGSISYWSDNFINLFNSINITKSVMLVILSVIYIVAIFNLVSSNLIEIKSREKTISMFKLLGMRNELLISLFVVSALFRATLGISFGVILGLLFSESLGVIFNFIEVILGGSLINADIYGIDIISGRLFFSEVSKLIAIFFCIAIVVSYLSAKRVTKLVVSQVLRNE